MLQRDTQCPCMSGLGHRACTRQPLTAHGTRRASNAPSGSTLLILVVHFGVVTIFPVRRKRCRSRDLPRPARIARCATGTTTAENRGSRCFPPGVSNSLREVPFRARGLPKYPACEHSPTGKHRNATWRCRRPQASCSFSPIHGPVATHPGPVQRRACPWLIACSLW